MGLPWEYNLEDEIKFAKPNICSTYSKTSHFDSQGYVSLFGNKGFFGMTDEISSVNIYTNKKSTNPDTQQKIDETALKIETICATEVHKAVEGISQILSQTKNVIAPILQVSYDMQMEYGNINLKKVLTSDDGLWYSEVCMNAITRIFHTEKNPTYTLINVPEQQQDPKKDARNDTYFLFEINLDMIYALKMSENICFLFHGSLITNRQFSQDGYEDKKVRDSKVTFFNIACYRNERLYKHIKKSFKRAKKLKGTKDP